MSKPILVVGIFSVSLLALGAGGASAQGYPNKPIRFVTSAPGGGTDYGARTIASGISVLMDQKVIVDNRTTLTATEIVGKALPDGYTVLFNASPFWIYPLMLKTAYDPVRDFAPITLVSQAPQILVVHPSVPATTVKELIAVAKAKPETLNYLSTGSGSTNHLAGELFNAKAGVKLVHVSYKGTGTAMIDLLSGAVHIRFGTGPAVEPHVKAGKLRALAVSTAQPSTLYPTLPTVASTVPGYEWVSYILMAAPAKTPAPIIRRLNQEVVRVLNQAEVKQKFLGVGTEVYGSSPEEFSAKMKTEMAVLGKVIKDAGIRADPLGD